MQSGIVVPQPKGTWVQHNQSTSLGAVTRRSVSSCCAVASPSCGKVFQDSWSRGEAVRKAKPKLPKALLGGRQPFHEPKFADFFRRLSPNQPEIGIVRAFLSHQAWLVCSLAVSRTSKPSPMPIRRSRPHAVPWGVCSFTGRGQQRPYTRSPAARPLRTIRAKSVGRYARKGQWHNHPGSSQALPHGEPPDRPSCKTCWKPGSAAAARRAPGIEGPAHETATLDSCSASFRQLRVGRNFRANPTKEGRGNATSHWSVLFSIRQYNWGGDNHQKMAR